MFYSSVVVAKRFSAAATVKADRETEIKFMPNGNNNCQMNSGQNETKYSKLRFTFCHTNTCYSSKREQMRCKICLAAKQFTLQNNGIQLMQWQWNIVTTCGTDCRCRFQYCLP